MSIWFVRHGETELNASRTLQPADTPLSARGIRQAEAVAQRLASLPLAGLVSSDLPRAWRTAEAIAKTTGLTPVASPLLHERNFGDLRGQPYDAFGYDPLRMHDAPPAGESMVDFAERCQEAFDSLLQYQRQLGGPLVVVSHGLVIRSILMALPPSPLLHGELPRLANTSVTRIAAHYPHQVHLLNSVEHLTGDLREDHQSLSGG